MRIGNFNIANPSRPYIIAEAGINHCGEVNKALEMIEVAKSAGANAIKFQTFKADEFCSDLEQEFTYKSQGKEITEPMYEMFKRMELTHGEWQQIVEYAKKCEIEFLTTPQNLSDLETILPFGMNAIKVGSDDLTNLDLISQYAKFKIPLILSSGMATLGEVQEALEASNWFLGAPVAVLVCTSQYPTPSRNANINRVRTLRNAFPGLIVGFSDHTIGNVASISAATLGAKIFEKHFTLSHDFPGPDHWFSLEPQELRSWVSDINCAFESIGNGIFQPSNEELVMRNLARRSVVANKDINTGESLTNENLALKRPGNGIKPSLINVVIGRTARVEIKKGEIIRFEDLV